MKSVNRFALAAGIAVAAAILTIGRANADPVTTEGHVESIVDPAGTAHAARMPLRESCFNAFGVSRNRARFVFAGSLGRGSVTT